MNAWECQHPASARYPVCAGRIAGSQTLAWGQQQMKEHAGIKGEKSRERNAEQVIEVCSWEFGKMGWVLLSSCAELAELCYLWSRSDSRHCTALSH